MRKSCMWLAAMVFLGLMIQGPGGAYAATQAAGGPWAWEHVGHGECDRRGSDEVTLILSGEPVVDVIDASGAPRECEWLFYLYRFEGEAGQQALIRLFAESFDPSLFLMNDDWLIFAEDDGLRGEDGAIIYSLLPESGTYYLAIGGAPVGDPALFALHLDIGDDLLAGCTPGEILSIRSGQPAIGVTFDTSKAEEYCRTFEHLYTFEAVEGDEALIELYMYNFLAEMTLLDRSYTPIAQGELVHEFGESWIFTDLPYTGRYFISIGSWVLQSPGSYDLFVDVGPDLYGACETDERTLLHFGQAVSNTVSLEGMPDFCQGFYDVIYTFDADQGEEIALRLTSTEAEVHVYLLNMDWSVVDEARDVEGDASGRFTASLERSLPHTGSYLVVARVVGRGAPSAEYTLALERHGGGR